MHGSVVSYGTITQLLIESASKEEIKEVMDFCYSVGLPVTLKELGVTDVTRVKIAAEKACIPGETIHNMAGDVTADQLYDALLAADLLGQEYFK
jgi:glycerol dehydrogenase